MQVINHKIAQSCKKTNTSEEKHYVQENQVTRS